MNRRSFAQEMEATRSDVGQIVMWCGVIALHQRYGIGPSRQDRLGKAVEEDSLIAQRAGLTWMMREIRQNLDEVLPAEELEFRVPMLRAPAIERPPYRGEKDIFVHWLKPLVMICDRNLVDLKYIPDHPLGEVVRLQYQFTEKDINVTGSSCLWIAKRVFEALEY